MAFAQVHRFHDKVALYAALRPGEGATVYLSPAAACDVADALRKAALSCEIESFKDSTCGTFQVEFEEVA